MTEVPAPLARLIDDAAIFPPGDLPLPEAVDAHDEHRRAEYADLVGSFVVSDQELPALAELAEGRATPLPVSLVITGGAGAIEGGVTWAMRAAGLHLAGLEIRLRDEDDLARNAQRVLAVLDQLAEPLEDVRAHVEPPPTHGPPSFAWLAALDELAAAEIALKFRTGSPDPSDAPAPTDLASWIDAALDRELPFKCTAGLHHALRGGTQHGFLNVLAATVASLDGGDVTDALMVTAPQPLVAVVQTDGERGRRWFRSFGSCSIAEPVHDLRELGLLA